MKWLGQYIQSFTARFRDDVYLESISDHGSDPDRFLTMDSTTGKITYRTGAEVFSDIGAASGDITSVSLISDSGTINGLTGAVNFTIEGGTNVTTSATGSTLTINGADNLYSTSYFSFSAKVADSTNYNTNYIFISALGISESGFSKDSGFDSAADFGLVATEYGGSGTDAKVDILTSDLEQQIPIPETCKLIGFFATGTTTTGPGSGAGYADYDIGVAIWHVPEANVNWGTSTSGEATLIHKSDSSRHTEGNNRKKVQMIKRMDGTAFNLAEGDILIPSLFSETDDQQIFATVTLVFATPIKTI
jgi:hypothetical protein